jgi:hypothetical protein
VSVNKAKKLPDVSMVAIIMGQLGFKRLPKDCDLGWVENISKGYKAVNMLEKVEAGEAVDKLKLKK